MGNAYYLSKEIVQSISDLGINSIFPNKKKMAQIIKTLEIDLIFTTPLKVDRWFEILSQGKFPHYKNVRPYDELKQASKPDFFHDFIGPYTDTNSERINILNGFFR